MSLSADSDYDLDNSPDAFEEADLFDFEEADSYVEDTDYNGIGSELHKAAYNNCYEIAESLLQNGADAGLVAEKGYTALHIAVKRGHVSLARLILKYSCPKKVKQFIDAKTTRFGYTALHLAARKDNYEATVLLLTYGANFEVKDYFDEMAIEVTDSEHVRTLLCSAAEISMAAMDASSNYNAYNSNDLRARLIIIPQYEYLATALARNNQGYTPLQVAINNKHLPTVTVIGDSRLARLKYDNKLPGSVKYLRETVWSCWQSIRRHLARLNADACTTTKALRHGSFVLHCAAKIVNCFYRYRETLPDLYDEPHVTFIEEVLEVLEFDKERYRKIHYFDEEAMDDIIMQTQESKYCTMLAGDPKSERRAFIDLIEYVICVPVVALVRNINSSKLLEAVKDGDLDTVKECAEPSYLVNMDIKDDDEKRPLHIAAEMGHYKMVRFLLDNNADMYLATERDNETPLHIATRNGYIRIVEILLGACDFGKVNYYINQEVKSTGRTALHLAVKANRLDIVWILLEIHEFCCGRDIRGMPESHMTSCIEINKLLQSINRMFDDVRDGTSSLRDKLKNLERDLLGLLGNVCNLESYQPPQQARLKRRRVLRFLKWLLKLKRRRMQFLGIKCK